MNCDILPLSHILSDSSCICYHKEFTFDADMEAAKLSVSFVVDEDGEGMRVYLPGEHGSQHARRGPRQTEVTLDETLISPCAVLTSF